jgi:polyphosphate:nucleotide phosphotransferase, PPK2 family
MKIHTGKFRVREDKAVDLGDWPTDIKPLYSSDEHRHTLMAAQVKRLSALQEKLYAGNQYALLIVLQAMDAAGKDSTIKHVMTGVNPQGCQVYSFKHPSTEELAHDFLWRTMRELPERGKIGIFNRSYYEEVLIVRVHPEILAAENLPGGAADGDKLWKHRFQSIRNLEKHLYRNGTRVLKFFLHVSKDEQRKRFLTRLDDPSKYWKFNEGDLAERARWKDYMHAYQECLSATSTTESPWYVVPADDKGNTRLIVGEVIADALDDLDLRFPTPTAAQRASLGKIRRALSRSR